MIFSTLTKFIDIIPTWGIFIVVITTIILSFDIGFRLGKKERNRGLTIEDITTASHAVHKVNTGAITATTLGLLALIIAFSFSTVTSRYQERKQLVIEEANVIGTTYLRAHAIPEVESEQAKYILARYIDLRLELVEQRSVSKIENASEVVEMQKELWAIALELASREPTPITALFMQSLNEMIDLHSKRVNLGIHSRMPNIFWIILYALTVLAMVMAGYDSGLVGGRRSTTALVTVSTAYALVILLIIALDRPGHRISVVSQDALIQLQQDIRPTKQLEH